MGSSTLSKFRFITSKLKRIKTIIFIAKDSNQMRTLFIDFTILHGENIAMKIRILSYRKNLLLS